MDDETLPQLRPRYGRMARWVAVGAAAMLAAWAGTVLVRHVVKGRSEAPPHRPPRAYVAPFGAQPEALARVDLARVHRELLPRWVLAESDASRSAPALSRLAELRAEAGKDPNLSALLGGFQEASALAAGEPRAARFTELTEDWNGYLEGAGAPWRAELTVRAVKHRQTMYEKTYRIVSAVTAQVGTKPARLRFVLRADRLNVVEPYLGHTSSREEGALVVIDRLRELGQDQVWPLLEERAESSLPPAERPLAASVREEASRALPAASFAVLQAMAAPRAELLRLSKELDARARCGSELHLGPPPLTGYAPAFLGTLPPLVVPAGSPCAPLTADELATLQTSSAALAGEGALPLALDELTAWLGRAVGTHELRHAADGGLDGFSTPCPACPPELGPAGRAELSAYLTALGTPGITYLSLYQACTGAQVGAARQAVSAIAAALLPDGCTGAPPADLRARAVAAERRWFAREEPVVASGPWLIAPLPRE